MLHKCLLENPQKLDLDISTRCIEINNVNLNHDIYKFIMEDLKTKINFIGIGAQKSGTSWLYKQFEKSNQIDITPIKELHYFDRSQRYPSPNFLGVTKLFFRILNPKWTFRALSTTLRDNKNSDWYKKWFFSNYSDEWYLSLFENFKKCKGEITPAYAILVERDIKRMSKLLGANTKIIFLVRHPVERSWSSYKYKYGVKIFNESNLNHIKTYLRTHEQLSRSNYLDTINLYKKYFDTVFVGFFDAILENPKQLLNDIFEYLELNTEEINNFSGLNERVNTSKKLDIPKEIESILNQLYEKQIEHLGLTYGEYFNNWDNQEESIAEKSCAWKSSIII